MRDFTDSLESLEDIQGKYPPSTLVLRAQFVYMLQEQFRDLERDYRKISEMYVAEMEKAAKLEQQVRHEKRKRCLAKAENTLNKARDFESMEALAVRHNGQVAKRYMKKKVRKFRHWRKWLELAERFEEVE